MNASLNEKLRAVKWGEYKLGDLFEINPTKYYRLANDKILSKSGITPLVSNASIANGVMGFSNLNPLNKGNSLSCSDTTLGAETMYYQKNDYIGYQHIQSLMPKFDRFNSAIAFFIISASHAATSNGQYDYGHKFNRKSMRKTVIFLPICDDGSIDFDFMESFIAELEAERVAELEAERVAELSAYLKVSGLDNYELSVEEQNALQEYETLDFSEFDITEIFEIKNTSNILSTQIKENSGNTPYLCASSENNGVSSYITYDKRYLEKGNCIFIGGKTFVVSYQENDFFSNDSHNLALYLRNCDKSKLKHFYIATCLFKSLSHKYSWGNSISKTKIKNDKISLPIKDGKPNYDVMELLISAVQKLVIKDVVKYSDAKISATKQVIQEKGEF